MISFNTDMQNEKIAAIALVIIIAGALSVYLGATYGEDILKNLFGEEAETAENIALGDCVDVHYIGRYASNNTVFDTSYADVENKTGGTPLKIFVSLNKSAFPTDEEYMYYSPGPLGMIEGFIPDLIGMKKGESKTNIALLPEKAFGVYPKVGDVINFSLLGAGDMKLIEIKENVPMPSEFEEYLGSENTTVYVLRDESHYIGEVVDLYAIWKNSTVVTKINETLIWTYTTPPADKYENLTWVEFGLENEIPINQTTYPENSSKIIWINETTIIVTHTPAINKTIQFEDSLGLSEYIVENVTDDKIITYLKDDSAENKTTREFNRTVTVQRNETQNIAHPFPSEYLGMLLEYLRSLDSTMQFSLDPLADETLYFEVEIVKIYKTSQAES